MANNKILINVPQTVTSFNGETISLSNPKKIFFEEAKKTIWVNGIGYGINDNTGSLTIQKNGETIDTFYANQTGNTSVNIEHVDISDYNGISFYDIKYVSDVIVSEDGGLTLATVSDIESEVGDYEWDEMEVLLADEVIPELDSSNCVYHLYKYVDGEWVKQNQELQKEHLNIYNINSELLLSNTYKYNTQYNCYTSGVSELDTNKLFKFTGEVNGIYQCDANGKFVDAELKQTHLYRNEENGKYYYYDNNDMVQLATLDDIKDGKLTIQKNSENIGEFTANQSGDTTINIANVDITSISTIYEYKNIKSVDYYVSSESGATVQATISDIERVVGESKVSGTTVLLADKQNNNLDTSRYLSRLYTYDGTNWVLTDASSYDIAYCINLNGTDTEITLNHFFQYHSYYKVFKYTPIDKHTDGYYQFYGDVNINGIYTSDDDGKLTKETLLSNHLYKNENDEQYYYYNEDHLIKLANDDDKMSIFQTEVSKNKIVISKSENEVEESNAEIGGETFDDEPTINKVATELGVKNYVDSIDTELLVEITYDELKTLRDNKQLEKGTQYRITDYQCTTTSDNTQSAGHQFDIIVTADSESMLNENARAIQHDGDTYFDNCHLEAWELKYCLDNDSNIFAWTDETNGKGVIYYMKDEFENECAYDFKNIMYKLRKLTSITWNSAVPEDTQSDYEDEFVGHYVGSWFSVNNCGSVTLSDTDVKYFYTFNKGESDADDVSDGSIPNQDSLDNMCRQNMIPEYIEWDGENRYLLNWIIFKPFSTEDDCFANVFGKNCHNNLFDYSWTHENSFGNECYNNSFGNDCCYNSFGNDCYRNTFGNNCHYNSFANYCFINIFGTNSSVNSFGNDCYRNTFGNDCCYNSFGNDCAYNSFGVNCTYNSFGNGGQYNSFGTECDGNSFENICHHNSFGTYCRYNSFGNECAYNTLNDYCESNKFGNKCGYNASESASTSTGNILGAYSYSNTFGHHCYANKLYNDASSPSKDTACYNNTFGNRCYSNILYYGCYNIIFANFCYSNTFGLYCYSNTFGDNCAFNSFGNYCYSNTFGYYCYSNTFNSECYSNTFGNNCHHNTFGTRCISNTFGNDCSFIKFGNSSSTKSYFKNIIVESSNEYLYLDTTQTISDAQPLKNIHIVKGVNNTSNYITITIDTVNQSYETRVERNRDTENIRIYNIEADKQDRLVAGSSNVTLTSGTDESGHQITTIDVNSDKLLLELTKSLIDSLFNDNTIGDITNGTTTINGTISNSTIITSNTIKYTTLM